MTITVTDSDVARQPEGTPPSRNWVLYNRAAGTGVFRPRPGNPPIGVGSLELATPTAADKVWLFNYDHMGVPLRDINKMSYETFRTQGAGSQVAAINLQVDVNGAAPADLPLLFSNPCITRIKEPSPTEFGRDGMPMPAALSGGHQTRSRALVIEIPLSPGLLSSRTILMP